VPPSSRLAANQAAFSAALGRAKSSNGRSSPDSARDAAEQFVAATLILPLLKQLRATNNAAPPFAPTQAERQFAALQDAETAQRISHATHFPLVDRLARDLLTKSGLETQELRAGALPDRAAAQPMNPLGAPRAAR
jgi:Rod binding domain-containing protein